MKRGAGHVARIEAYFHGYHILLITPSVNVELKFISFLFYNSTEKF